MPTINQSVEQMLYMVDAMQTLKPSWVRAAITVLTHIQGKGSIKFWGPLICYAFLLECSFPGSYMPASFFSVISPPHKDLLWGPHSSIPAHFVHSIFLRWVCLFIYNLSLSLAESFHDAGGWQKEIIYIYMAI